MLALGMKLYIIFKNYFSAVRYGTKLLDKIQTSFASTLSFVVGMQVGGGQNSMK